MTSNDSTIMRYQNTIESPQNDKIAINTLKIYNTLYIAYFLLYCKGHIQITSNDKKLIVVTKNSRVNIMTKLHSTDLNFTINYISLTSYYTVKDTFRSWVMTAQWMWK